MTASNPSGIILCKTAWRICHELRKLMSVADPANNDQMSGHIEIDETYVGGVARGGPAVALSNKTIVFGMLERGGNIVAGPVPNTGKATLEPLITTYIEQGSIISTDEHPSYGDD